MRRFLPTVRNWQTASIFVFLCLILLFQFKPQNARAEDNDLEKDTRMVINLLDYIGRDYSKAVKRGRVINTSEFAEMRDFTDKTITLVDSISEITHLAGLDKIAGDLRQLKNQIQHKRDYKIIREHSNRIKQNILRLKIIKIVPSEWPDLFAGKKVYLKNCASCHGKNGGGDGKLAAEMDPRPANFLDAGRMSGISPFQNYNTIRLGVPGTAMRPFAELSEKEVWNVSFYISSLRWQEKYLTGVDSLATLFNNIKTKIGLKDVVTLSDQQLLVRLKMQVEHGDDYLAALRLHIPVGEKRRTIDFALAKLDSALHAYRQRNYTKAEDLALAAYLKGIEPNEQRLNAVNPKLVAQIEQQMNRVRRAIKKRVPENELAAGIAEAKAPIVRAASLLAEQKFSFWFTFMLAASILLREGLEAFLIILAVLSVLKSLAAQQAERYVHAGWIVAVVIGVCGWFFTDWLLQFGAQNREVLEGVGSLFAVLMLLYIGFWLHSKTEITKWTQFIKGRVTRLTEGNNLFGLGLMSFVVVFREAFESVLFLSALSLEANPQSKPGIWMGSLSAFILVLVLAWIALKFAKKIPVRTLFKISALTMAALAIILAGQGVHALEESGYVSVTPLFINLRFSLLGIYPTVQTMAAQLLILALTIFLWLFNNRSFPGKK